jgi:hypothetical protein
MAKTPTTAKAISIITTSPKTVSHFQDLSFSVVLGPKTKKARRSSKLPE